MSRGTVEERLEKLERELAVLKAQVKTLTPRGDWRSVVGLFAGDEVMREILEKRGGKSAKKIVAGLCRSPPRTKANAAYAHDPFG